MITDYIHKMFLEAFKKQWYETYWVFDLHGTIIKPTYKGTEMIFYPWALETLQSLCLYRPDIKKILWTSSFPEEIDIYLEGFKREGIVFEGINENPNISSKNGNFGFYDKKFYFNVLIDDKAGFDPEEEWDDLYWFLNDCYQNDFLPDPKWTTKF
jgi:hypothetical protein